MKIKRLGLVALAAVMALTVASCKEKEGVGKYTYNYSMSVFPNNWNPHTYETATDSEILGYTSAGFYTFDYNDTLDGYDIVPDMAVGDPQDVSGQYVGEEWGIAEGETGRAWKIDLREDLAWETGEAITAADFVESAKLLLNPAAQNYRADSLYSGNMVLVNAKNYLYQGQHAYETPMISSDYLDEEYVAMDQFTTDSEGHIIAPNGSDVAIKLSAGSSWSKNSIKKYADYGYFQVDEEGNELEAWTKLLAAADKDNNYLVVLTNETVRYLQDSIAWLQGFENAEAYSAALAEAGRDPEYAYKEWQEMCLYGADYAAVDFANVGIKDVNGDLVIILEKELSGFYLLYNLTGSWLVHAETYKECETVDEVTGVYQNNYGTSVETFVSYGPYKLTEFQMDKQFHFEKNEHWYGYNDESEVTTYQTTDIVCQYVAEASTRLQMFEAGQLDSYGLTADDMAEYSSSDYLYYTEGASTFFVALNPDLNQLTATQAAAGDNVNKTILTTIEFRQALSFALDRAAFALACDPTGKPANAVFNSLIISDPEKGTAYRTVEESKDVVLNFWGLADDVGPGKRYATKDEAIASITGVDLAQAKEKFTQAYNKAIEAGLMDADDTVQLTIGLASATSPFYTKGYDYLVNCWTDAVAGTPLEGKLTFTKDDTIANDFSSALKNNQVDVLFGVGWSGSALDPYNLVSAYTLPSYQYDDSIDYTQVIKDIHFDQVVDVEGTTHNNVTLRADVYDWSVEALAGEVIECEVVVNGEGTKTFVKLTAGSKADLTFRTKILNACEAAILEQYTMLPLIDDASAALKGMKINYYTETYVYGVGRGGVKYMTYNYDDAEWAEFVESNNGLLQYK